MTRNDIKALFPDATKEQIDSLLDINSNDIGKAVNKGQTTQDQLEAQITSLNERIKTLDEQAKSLNGQIKSLTSDLAQRDSTIKSLNDDKDKALTDLRAQFEVDTKALNDAHANELNNLNAQLKDAQGKAQLAESLTDRVTQLTQTVADRDATIRNDRKNYHIQNELRNLKARDIDVIMPLLKKDDITEDDDGNLNGLAEQVEALKSSYGYLFDSNPGNNRGGFAGTPDVGNGAGSPNDAVNQAIRALSGHN